MPQLSDLVARNLWLKLAALGLALLLWSVVRADAPARATVSSVPIEVLLEDPAWVVVDTPSPPTASIVFTGSARELLRLLGETPRIVLPVDNVNDSLQSYALSTPMVRMGGPVEAGRIAEIRPARVRLQFERVDNVLRPVAVRTRGELPVGVRLDGRVRAEPAYVQVTGPRSRIVRLDSVPLQPFDISGLTEPETLHVRIDTSAVRTLRIAPSEVAVIVPAEPVPDSLLSGRRGAAADTTRGRP
ncbi:MAG: CdaR family protein [Longimicrobiales bacterium]